MFPTESPRRPSPAPPRRAERLQKLLAAAGLGSRREIERWIAEGRVTVNGRPATLGTRASAVDEIALDGRRLRLGPPQAPRLLLYHKPVGELVTRRDPEGRPTVFARLPRLSEGRWIAIGRLDLNSSGLLLFTTSGEIAHRLMHPRHGAVRAYRARIRGELDAAKVARLLSGVRLEGIRARFEALEPESTGPGTNRWVRVRLREGRNREVRRLFGAVGLMVSRLVRIRYGPFVLPRDLEPGRWKELPRADVVRLVEDC